MRAGPGSHVPAGHQHGQQGVEPPCSTACPRHGRCQPSLPGTPAIVVSQLPQPLRREGKEAARCGNHPASHPAAMPVHFADYWEVKPCGLTWMHHARWRLSSSATLHPERQMASARCSFSLSPAKCLPTAAPGPVGALPACRAGNQQPAGPPCAPGKVCIEGGRQPVAREAHHRVPGQVDGVQLHVGQAAGRGGGRWRAACELSSMRHAQHSSQNLVYNTQCLQRNSLNITHLCSM